MMRALTASAAVSAENGEKPLTAKMLRAIDDIGHRHFDERPRKVERLGGGRTNTVLGFRVSSGRYVLRMHQCAGKIHDYLKEQWAMDAARAAGVPTAHVLEVASLDDGRPYMIQERIEGVTCRDLIDRMVPLRDMGKFAARLHAVRTRGYGQVFDWSSNELSRRRRWTDYLAHDFDAEGRLASLQKLHMVNSRQARALRISIRVASDWRKTPVLNHGDLRLKNLIVDANTSRVRAVVDWENCLSFPPPYWDLSIALHELGVDEKEAFLEGYGMKPAQFAALVPFVRMLNVLNYAHPVQSAHENRQLERLDWFRLRLAAGLELYEAA